MNLAYLGEHEHEGVKIRVTGGDFSVFMNKVVEAMQKAEVYAANKN